MKIPELLKLLNEDIVLRPVNDNKVEEYAERMEAGVEFPSVKIGQWPKSDKYGDTGIVDGIHRVFAAKKAGKADLKSESIVFKSIQEALSYMYTANMAHGLPPTEGQRNARMVLLKKIDPTLTLEKMAEQFKIGKSSVDRILKGTQGEGKSGPKSGAKKSVAHKSLEPLKAKVFLSLLEKINYTLERVRPTAEIVAYVTPEGTDGVVLNTEHRDTIRATEKFLGILLKAIAEIK